MDMHVLADLLVKLSGMTAATIKLDVTKEP